MVLSFFKIAFAAALCHYAQSAFFNPNGQACAACANTRTSRVGASITAQTVLASPIDQSTTVVKAGGACTPSLIQVNKFPQNNWLNPSLNLNQGNWQGQNGQGLNQPLFNNLGQNQQPIGSQGQNQQPFGSQGQN